MLGSASVLDVAASMREALMLVEASVVVSLMLVKESLPPADRFLALMLVTSPVTVATFLLAGIASLCETSWPVVVSILSSPSISSVADCDEEAVKQIMPYIL